MNIIRFEIDVQLSTENGDGIFQKIIDVVAEEGSFTPEWNVESQMRAIMVALEVLKRQHKRFGIHQILVRTTSREVIEAETFPAFRV